MVSGGTYVPRGEAPWRLQSRWDPIALLANGAPSNNGVKCTICQLR